MTSSDTNSSGMMGGGPNACGAYEPSEHLELPHPGAGWRGLPIAEIDLLRLDDGWRWSTGLCLPGGGHATPLTKRCAPLATRDDALNAAIDHLRGKLDGDTGPAASDARHWLDTLHPAQPDLFSALAA